MFRRTGFLLCCRKRSSVRNDNVKCPQVSFQVGDALQQPFPDGQFDLVWSMESGEHMPDKSKVFSSSKFFRFN